jgi:replication factor C subunit 3/5
MVFLIDKYQVKSLNDVICHKKIYQSLFSGYYEKDLNDWTNWQSLNIIKDNINNCSTHKEFYDYLKNIMRTKGNDPNKYSLRYQEMPNLLIYGPTGSGKKTLINLLLEDIFDEQIHNIKKVTYQITGYGNSNESVQIDQSNYHIIIEPSNSGFDKYLIQEIVKSYAEESILKVHDCKTPFKVVLINNIDNLSYYAQTSLRCTMEKYHKTCKFILCGYQSSKIIDPLRSRCLNIRIPRPSYNELYQIIFNIGCKEKITIDQNEMYNIVTLSERNIKKALWMLELYNSGIKNYDLEWKKNINNIITIICNFNRKPSHVTYNSNIIYRIREILYTVFITNVNGNQIITELLTLLFNCADQFNSILFSEIIQIFGYYETRINKGKRSVIHLEALINSILYHIIKFNG